MSPDPRKVMTIRPVSLLAVCLVTSFGLAQSRLPDMPGYDLYREFQPKSSLIQLGRAQGQWVDENTYAWSNGGEWFAVDVPDGKVRELSGRPSGMTGGRSGSGSQHRNSQRRRPARGRQYTETFTSDGSKRAYYSKGNVFLGTESDGSQVTTDGDVERKVVFGTASWVYGEELNQNEAMGFSPDGRYLWYYQTDARPVRDYYMALDQTEFQTTLDVEAYPKAGTNNPIMDVLVYDTETQESVVVDVRPGEFDEGVGHYVYAIDFSPSGDELYFHRTNRWQNVMEFCAADPQTGESRVIVREEWPSGWTNNRPSRIYLDEHEEIDEALGYSGKALWFTERNGWSNIVLLDLNTGETNPVTRHEDADVQRVVRLDLADGWLWYLAGSGDNHYKSQLHRVRLDGTSEQSLTDPALHHSVEISPDGQYFVDIAESVENPPVSVLRKIDGTPVATLAESDLTAWLEAGFRPIEKFEFLAGDGETELKGRLHFPPNFDSAKKYPLIVSVYGGPGSSGYSERYGEPSRITNFGFLVAQFEHRGGSGRGKAFLDEMYLKLGETEIDDQAAGVRYLADRPYVDGGNVGVTGTSYGGYSSAMCLLRYPDLFKAAVANSSVTDWRHYDTIYTERYMRTPEANPDGYKFGDATEYAGDLEGYLMLFYGTSDNNVHQSNTHRLIRALQQAGKWFEVQVGPDQGHTAVRFERMMEFFIERLVMGRE